MNFVLASNGWRCQFLEDDCRTLLRRKLTFADPDKLRELAARGGALGNLESKHALEYGIQVVRGSTWLSLTAEQYETLK